MAAKAKPKTKSVPGSFFEIGAAYLIRTVTMAWTGRVIGVNDNEILLDDAAWIADTGRYHQATAETYLSEVEPREGTIIIGRGAIVDASIWTSPLPRSVK